VLASAGDSGDRFGADCFEAAWTLREMGLCVREARRPGEAEALFRRALEIREAKLGAEDVAVARTLHQMGRCLREAGRQVEAENHFRRALSIMEVAHDTTTGRTRSPDR
ncbi:unnamed protein product, partial [Ectocarpus sp. 8 AP-2014]